MRDFIVVVVAMFIAASSAHAQPVPITATGALCDGVTVETTRLQGVLNANNDVFIPNGKTCVACNLTVSANFTRISGAGAGSVLKMCPGGTGTLLDAGQNTVTLIDFALDGGSRTDKRTLTEPESNRSGLSYAPQAPGTRISGLHIHGFGNQGWIQVAYTQADRDNFGDHAIVSDTWVSNNYKGIVIGPAGNGEYTNYANLQLNKNTVAATVNSGNTTASNTIIANNGFGIQLDGIGYANNGHGNWNNSLINHSVNASIAVNNIPNGYNFIGNNVHLGDVVQQNSTGLKFSESIFQVRSFVFSGGGRNYVTDNFMLPNAALPNTVLHHSGGATDATAVERNFTSTGAFPASDGAAK